MLILSRDAARPLFWAAAIFAFVMAVLPHPPMLFVPDKVLHALAFLVLAALGTLAYPHVRKRNLLLALAAFGAFIEMVQGLPGVHRDSDPLDWLTDVVAAFVVFALIALWRRENPIHGPAPDEPDQH